MRLLKELWWRYWVHHVSDFDKLLELIDACGSSQVDRALVQIILKEIKYPRGVYYDYLYKEEIKVTVWRKYGCRIIYTQKFQELFDHNSCCVVVLKAWDFLKRLKTYLSPNIRVYFLDYENNPITEKEVQQIRRDLSSRNKNLGKTQSAI